VNVLRVQKGKDDSPCDRQALPTGRSRMEPFVQ
jgi:hypothetical protein